MFEVQCRAGLLAMIGVLFPLVFTTTSAAEIEATATIAPARSVEIAAKSVARVQEIHKEKSDQASQGETLVVLDNRTLKAELASAEANLALAKAEQWRAVKAEARAQRLFKSKTLPEEHLDAAVYNLEAAEQQIQIAKANIRHIHSRLDDTILSAPFAGVITAKQVELGQLTQPGAMLYTLQDQSTLKAIFNIKDQDIPHLQPGHSVLVMVPALNGKTFDARIKTIIPSGDPSTHEFQVEAVIPGAGGLLPGMFATVKSNN